MASPESPVSMSSSIPQPECGTESAEMTINGATIIIIAIKNPIIVPFISSMLDPRSYNRFIYKLLFLAIFYCDNHNTYAAFNQNGQ